MSLEPPETDFVNGSCRVLAVIVFLYIGGVCHPFLQEADFVNP